MNDKALAWAPRVSSVLHRSSHQELPNPAGAALKCSFYLPWRRLAVHQSVSRSGTVELMWVEYLPLLCNGG